MAVSSHHIPGTFNFPLGYCKGSPVIDGTGITFSNDSRLLSNLDLIQEFRNEKTLDYFLGLYLQQDEPLLSKQIMSYNL